MAQTDKQYFKDYFEESRKIQSEFTVVDRKRMIHVFDKDQVLVEINAMPKSIQKKIRTKFVQIDFMNGNPNHFINYILRGLVN